MQVSSFSSSELDITDQDAVRAKIAASAADFVINAAAYTAVDRAESEPERAYQVNESGPGNLATICAELNIPLIHVSTDYVFPGTSSVAYLETDKVGPAAVYGASKLAGEQRVRSIWDKHIIIRTAWVFSEYGNNFVKTMLKLAQTRNQLSVVADQIGCPTDAGDIAGAILDICRSREENWGTYHYVGETVVSWSQFARQIFTKALDVQLIEQPVLVADIVTAEYPTAATRPAYSVLDTGKITTVFGIGAKPLDRALDRVLGLLERSSLG